MRELEKDLSKALTMGLRRERYQESEPALVECFNAVPREWGLDAYIRPADAILDVPETDWPFPRAFVGGNQVFLATKDKLHLVNGDWSLTELCDANQAIDMADFGDYVVFSCINQVVVKDTELGTFGPILADSSFPEFRTCCNFNGQLVVGYIESTWNGCGAESLGWSNIGTSDFTCGPGNEAGFRRVHWNKLVYRVKKLAETVMVYGDNGIGMLFPHEQTFGYRAISNLGLYSKWALTGTESIHFWVSSDGDLWKLVADGKPEKLGYKEFLSTLYRTRTTCNFDLRKGHVYISDNTKTFVYNGRGLFQVGILPSTVFSLDQYLVGCFSEFDDDDYDFQSDDMVVAVDSLQPEIRAMKTITEVLVDNFAQEKYLYVGAKYKYTNYEDYTATSWERAQYDGRFRLQLTAPDIQVRLRIRDYVEDDRLSRAVVRMQYPDGRYRRGVQK